MAAALVALAVLTALSITQAWITLRVVPRYQGSRQDLLDLTAKLDDVGAALVLWTAHRAPLYCARCAAEQHQTPAAVIADGESRCTAHAHTADRTPVRE